MIDTIFKSLKRHKTLGTAYRSINNENRISISVIPRNEWKASADIDIREIYHMIRDLSIKQTSPKKNNRLRYSNKTWVELARKAKMETLVMLGAHRLIKY